MKHLTIRFIIALITFIIGIAVVAIWYISRAPHFTKPENSVSISSSTEQQIPTVAYCELIREPQLYFGKMVRVRAIMYVDWTGFIHNQVMYDPINCSGEANHVWVEISRSSFDSLAIARKQLGDLMNLDRGPHWVRRAEIVAVGKLSDENKQRETPINLYRFQFIIQRLEQAESVSQDVGWP
jgi:hypothetical protein